MKLPPCSPGPTGPACASGVGPGSLVVPSLLVCPAPRSRDAFAETSLGAAVPLPAPDCWGCPTRSPWAVPCCSPLPGPRFSADPSPRPAPFPSPSLGALPRLACGTCLLLSPRFREAFRRQRSCSLCVCPLSWLQILSPHTESREWHWLHVRWLCFCFRR